MAGVEEDPEERVAEVAIDDRVEHPAGLTDVEGLVPLGDGREVRRDQALHVVGDLGRQPGLVLDHEARPGSRGRPRSRRRP